MQPNPFGYYGYYGYNSEFYKNDRRGRKFLGGLLAGVAACYFYWNNHSADYDSRPRYREDSTELPEEKNFFLESEDYKIIFTLIKKNQPGGKEAESKQNT